MGATKTPRPTKLRRFSRAQSTGWPCRDACLQGLQVSWQHPVSLPPDDQAASCPQQRVLTAPAGFLEEQLTAAPAACARVSGPGLFPHPLEAAAHRDRRRSPWLSPSSQKTS